MLPKAWLVSGSRSVGLGTSWYAQLPCLEGGCWLFLKRVVCRFGCPPLELAGRGLELKGEIAVTVVLGSQAFGACLPPPSAGEGEQPCLASTREKASSVTRPSKGASPRLTL